MIRYKTPRILPWLAVLIIGLIPFHAFLTVWLASFVGHYTALRLWKEFLLAVLAGGAIYLLAADTKLRKGFLASRLNQFILVYILISLVWAKWGYLLHKVTAKAAGYGLIVNLRFLVFFLAIWVIATKSPKLRQLWPKLLLIPAAIVVTVGLLQRLVLPYDVLKHFGYGSSTIYPYETINHNLHYPRVMSTLRGANPLGAYLILILDSLAVLWVKARKYRLWLGIFGAAGLLTLIFSYSRGAWLGFAVSLLILGWIWLVNRQARRLLYICVAAVLVTGVIAALAFRHNSTFENTFLHTQSRSTAKESSNQNHVSAFRTGLHDAVHEPLGRGVGTAGPASVYNANRVRIPENYFIQLAQEVGWLGLAIFLSINLLVASELWRRRGSALALALVASLVGLTVVNLFSHGWTDDTIAYIWWGLAGVAIAAPAVVRSRGSDKNT